MTDEQTGHGAQTTQASDQRMVGGRYRLLAELGRGGMGVVWRAEDTVMGREVAIKEIRLGGDTDAEDPTVLQERVLREVRTGGRLNDPAVVTVYNVVHENGETFIVMELVEAPTLSQLVKQNGPLPEQQAAAIGEQVLSALTAAHQAGIVHRDVKPGNIMVGPNGRVKLTDFGIAQAVDDPRLTTSGMLVGSPAFMAPERVAGQDATPASDLWALGASLFFAVEGTVAHERATTAATLHAIMSEVPRPVRAQGPLGAAITGLLNPAPHARLTAEQAMGLLQQANPRAVPTPPGGHTQVYGGSYPPTQVAGYPTPPAGGKRKRTTLVVGVVTLVLGALVGGFFLGKPVWSPAVDEAMAPTLTYGRGGDVADISVGYGDVCLNAPITAGRSVTDSTWVSCDDPHYAEWITSVAPDFQREDGEGNPAYPGLTRMREFGEAACATVFHTSAVPPTKRVGLRYQALVPTMSAWEGGGQDENGNEIEPVHEVLCFAVTADGGRVEGGAVAGVG